MDSNAIAWTSELATGDSKIDEQHRTLIELIAAVPQSISPECEGILARAPSMRRSTSPRKRRS